MPHFGLMDADALGPENAALQRARLHIRGGNRRLRQGKISAGIVTLYDALSAAMEWYIAAPERRKTLDIRPGENLNDERSLYSILTRSGVIRTRFPYDKFDALVDRASEEMPGYDYRWITAGVDSIMTELGVMPFDEKELPPEDPSTY